MCKRRISVNPVDLVTSFQTGIYLQNLALIHPRTSLSEFAKKLPKVRIKARIKVRKNIGDRRRRHHGEPDAGRRSEASHDRCRHEYAHGAHGEGTWHRLSLAKYV